MRHKLPPLPYSLDALEPYMSRETLEFHHGKHHKAYVDKLNELIQGTEYESMPLEQIVQSASGEIFNNAGQAWNHTFFWNCLQPDGGGAPSGPLSDAIAKKWGSAKAFREAFTKSAVGNFGSGWTWLVRKGDAVEIVNTSNADTPLTTGNTPLLTLDVWEHAYYIDHRNARPKFVSAFLNHLINWDWAERQFAGEPAQAAATLG